MRVPSPIMHDANDYLQIKGDDIVLDGKPILLKGAGLGGWMNMENFITGYPGHEFQVRAALKKVLGEEKYDFFFDKFLEYFFTEEDAKLYAELGLNCLRLPVNYRHFEDDMNPRVFKKEGLKHLDRVIDICAKYGIYTVIDLHAAPGGQNCDWHSDAGNDQALFFDHKDFQDRTVLIWEHLAKHYRDNTWVAGYNPLNEPTDEQHVRLLAFYKRVEKAIRKIDPHHLLFLDGNTFGGDFRHFEEPLPNCVYACHDYSNYGFPSAPELFTGTPEQIEWHKRSFNRKIEYMQKHKIPIWNGEFGPVYQNANDGLPNWEEINESRYKVLECQLGLYANAKTSWSIWLWKDIGFQGMTYVDPESPYIKLLQPFLDKKRRLATDSWGCDTTPVEPIFEPINKWMLEAAPALEHKYPSTWRGVKHISRMLRNCLLSECLVDEYASYFEGKSMQELDELAQSFKLSKCQQRTRLNDILKEDSKRAAV
ncbi:glycoside hydrolase superfamily [Kockovaella imperatae]|uniref:Glycoside hydrolase superfamily n=1 Tax=Kockovaella imperatae TaxID=4999 RepID=A0A1Y1UTV3_9TREE|nr:glycoside hydrolase superfamily [Kockovaella imperatae]ORX40964.1 glycoside hydrolase superfamily [Kockovaella imperatae]